MSKNNGQKLVYKEVIQSKRVIISRIVRRVPKSTQLVTSLTITDIFSTSFLKSIRKKTVCTDSNLVGHQEKG